MMEHTSNGSVEGYTHHEVKESGTDLQDTSIRFYARVLDLISRKEAIYRISPRASEHEGTYRFYARIHVKNELLQA